MTYIHLFAFLNQQLLKTAKLWKFTLKLLWWYTQWKHLFTYWQVFNSATTMELASDSAEAAAGSFECANYRHIIFNREIDIIIVWGCSKLILCCRCSNWVTTVWKVKSMSRQSDSLLDFDLLYIFTKTMFRRCQWFLN